VIPIVPPVQTQSSNLFFSNIPAYFANALVPFMAMEVKQLALSAKSWILRKKLEKEEG
jgi:hypothetical protein